MLDVCNLSRYVTRMEGFARSFDFHYDDFLLKPTEKSHLVSMLRMRVAFFYHLAARVISRSFLHQVCLL